MCVHTLLVWMQNNSTLLERNLAVYRKIPCELTLWPSSSTENLSQRCICKNTKWNFQRIPFHHLFLIAKDWKHSIRWSSTGEWLKNLIYPQDGTHATHSKGTKEELICSAGLSAVLLNRSSKAETMVTLE